MPILSILIPTYKRKTLLKEALSSVFKQARLEDIEIIVVDNDDDPNETLNDVITRFNEKKIVYYKNKKNLGMVGNWNKCIELANAPYISLLHDDDLLLNNFTDLMLSAIELLKPNLICCLNEVGKTPTINNLTTSHKTIKTQVINSIRLIEGNIVSAPGVIFKKELALQINCFNPNLYPCSDYDFYCRYITTFGKSYIIKEQLAFYRIFDNETYKGNTLINMIKVTNSVVQGIPCPVPLAKKFISRSNTLNGWFKDLKKYSNDYEFEKNKLCQDLKISKLETSFICCFIYRLFKKIICSANNYLFEKKIALK